MCIRQCGENFLAKHQINKLFTKKTIEYYKYKKYKGRIAERYELCYGWKERVDYSIAKRIGTDGSVFNVNNAESQIYRHWCVECQECKVNNNHGDFKFKLFVRRFTRSSNWFVTIWAIIMNTKFWFCQSWYDCEIEGDHYCKWNIDTHEHCHQIVHDVNFIFWFI